MIPFKFSTFGATGSGGGGITVESDPVFSTWAQTFSANYQNTYGIVNQNSPKWDEAYTSVNGASSNWNVAFTNLQTNSAAYLAQPDLTLIQNTSATWSSTTTTVQNNSGNWNYQGTDIKSLTASWENTTNVFGSQSANNDSVYSTVNTNSAAWASGNGSETDPKFTTWANTYSAGLQSTSTTVAQNSAAWNYSNVAIGGTLDGAGQTLSTGSKGSVTIPYNAILNNVTVTSPQSGSIVIDVKKGTYTSFPSTSSITGSNKPTISSGYKYFDGSLNTWTKNISAGDILEFVVDSVTDIQYSAIVFQATKVP